MEKKLKLKYVTFEQAKLLKEKQFGLTPDCYITLHSFYDEEGNLITEPSVYKRNISETHLEALTLDNVDVGISQGLDNSLDGIYLAPEQYLVAAWLQIVHKIQLAPSHNYHNRKFYYQIEWYIPNGGFGTIYKDNGWEEPDGYDSIDAAYSAAFDYVLKELI